MADTQQPATPTGAPENSVRPSKKLHRQGAAAPEAAQPADPAPPKPAHSVPEEVRKRFVQVKNKYYFPDGVRAFTDRGTRLTTVSENTEVIRSLIQIAEARGWNEITVRGTERFRKEAWQAAHLVGINVRGYKPTEHEQARLVRTAARQGSFPVEDSVAEGARPEAAERLSRPARERRDELLLGKLADHGRATYQNDPRAPMSYFVTLETAKGDRTVWGVDLERAFKESLTQPQAGDEVGLRTVRREAVTVRAHRRNEAGEVIDRDLETHRNQWIIEKRSFFEERAQVARAVRDTSLNPKQVLKDHPELVGTYLQVRAAELAAKRIRDPQDRARFVAMVRGTLADSIARGEPLPAVRLRERATQRTRKTPEREPAPARG